MVRDVFHLTVAAMKGDIDIVNQKFDSFLDTTILLIESDHMSKEAESSLTDAFLSKDVEKIFVKETEVAPPTLRIYPNVHVEKVDTESEKEVHLVYSTKNVVIHDPPKDKEKEKEKEEEVNEDRNPVKIVLCKDNAKKDADSDVGEPESDGEEEEEEEEEEPESDAEEEEEAEEAESDAEEAEVEAEEAEEVEEVEEVEEAEAEEAEAEEEEVEEAEAEEEEEVEEADAEEADADAEEAEEEDEAMELVKIGKKQYFVSEISKLVYVCISEEEAGECLGKYEKGKIVPN